MQKSIEVRILGHDYALRVDEANEAAMREIAAYLDARMRKVRSSFPSPPSERAVAVLAALSITEELYLMRRRSDASPEVRRALREMADHLDEALGA